MLCPRAQTKNYFNNFYLFLFIVFPLLDHARACVCLSICFIKIPMAWSLLTLAIVVVILCISTFFVVLTIQSQLNLNQARWVSLTADRCIVWICIHPKQIQFIQITCKNINKQLFQSMLNS